MVPRRRAGEEDVVNFHTGGLLGLLKQILTTAGPVALIATLLCAFLMYAVWGRFDRLDASNQRLLAEMQQANSMMGAFAQRSDQADRLRDNLLAAQVKLLRQLCVNSAKSDFQTRACLQD